MKHITAVAVLCLLLHPPLAFPADAPGLAGTWKFAPANSTDLATWRSRTLRLSIAVDADNVLVLHEWLERNAVAYVDTFRCVPGAGPTTSVVTSEIWPDNWFMGVLADKGETRAVVGDWEAPGSILRITTRLPVRTSQGRTILTTIRRYALHEGGTTLTLTEHRSGRPTPVTLNFERSTHGNQ